MDLGLRRRWVLGVSGCRIPVNRVSSTAQGVSMVCERMLFCGGSVYGVKLRLEHVSFSVSAQSLASLDNWRERKGVVVRGGPSKAELQLVKDLQEFIASRDLPRDKIPTTTDLALRGRQDLAHRVRRRGYKQLTLLLEQVSLADSIQNEDMAVAPNGSVINNVTENDDAEISDTKVGDIVPPDGGEPSNVGSTTGGALEELPLFGSATRNARLNGHAHPSREELVGEVSRDQVVLGNEGRGEISLEEKYRTDYTDEADDDDDEEEEDNIVDATQAPGRQAWEDQDDIVYQKAALLKAKLLKYFDSRNADMEGAISSPNPDWMKLNGETHREQILQDGPNVNKKFEIPEELDRLKSLLHLRELELAKVSRELEESKAMLSLARAKAAAELVHQKQLTVEQDIQLQALEQALSLVNQVHLEWWGKAGQVEVSGSFNGWQNSIHLEPDFSSEIPNLDGSRGPMMWGVHLCLYCGVYEIKFIVDGNWQVDHRREVVQRNSHQNNVLRVE